MRIILRFLLKWWFQDGLNRVWASEAGCFLILRAFSFYFGGKVSGQSKAACCFKLRRIHINNQSDGCRIDWNSKLRLELGTVHKRRHNLLKIFDHPLPSLRYHFYKTSCFCKIILWQNPLPPWLITFLMNGPWTS